jgi:phosphate uptake regulator
VIPDLILDNYFQAIGAFIAGDNDNARKIKSASIDVERGFYTILDDLIKGIKDKSLSNPNIAEYLRITHHLTAIFSHIINICNRTIYLKTGELPTNTYLFYQI